MKDKIDMLHSRDYATCVKCGRTISDLADASICIECRQSKQDVNKMINVILARLHAINENDYKDNEIRTLLIELQRILE